MKFVNPGFLFALISIGIPIIIHLFNFRKFKQVYFTNVRFLKEVKQETQSRSKLKHLLVLFARILALAFLVFAFAQPYIPAEINTEKAGGNAMSIYIDNSFSMDALGKNGSLLTLAKNYAKDIVTSHKASDKFQVITNNFEGRHQRLVSKEEALELIDEVKTSANVKKTSEVITRQKDLLLNSEEENKKIYLISDFQKSSTRFNTSSGDTNVHINLLPVAAQLGNNLFIDSCWISSPVVQLNKNIELHVRIKNISDKVIENNPIKLFINDQPKTPASFSVEENGTAEIILYFTLKHSGIHNCRIELNDYPVSFDDTFYFTVSVSATIPVLSITGDENNNYLFSLFSKDSLFEYVQTNYKKIDYSSFQKYRLILLDGLNELSSGLSTELKRFVNNGGTLLVFPGPDININSYKEFSSMLNISSYEKKDTSGTRVTDINFDHEIFKGVFENQNKNIDLPAINTHYPIAGKNQMRQTELMKMQNGNIFMAAFPSGEGKVYLSAVTLNTSFSNFPKHAVFVPTLYQVALYSAPQLIKLFYTIGDEEPIEIRNKNISGESIYSIASINTPFETIPESKAIDFKTFLYPNNQITTAGNYILKSGNDTLSGIAFNYNRNESYLYTNTPEELQEQIESSGSYNITIIETGNKDIGDILTEREQGNKLWKLCIILALVFLGAEIALIRFLKN